MTHPLVVVTDASAARNNALKTKPTPLELALSFSPYRLFVEFLPSKAENKKAPELSLEAYFE
jgi:hypothetical protein